LQGGERVGVVGTTQGLECSAKGGVAVAVRSRTPVLMTAATVVLVGVTVAIAVFAGPIYDLAHRAGEQLMDPSDYIRAVLGS